MRDSSQFLGRFRRSVGIAATRQRYKFGRKLLRISEAAWKDALFNTDNALELLQISDTFYDATGNISNSISARCDAAAYFADVGAFQSAYRLLAEAEESAREAQLPHSLARVLAEHGRTGYAENDYPYAERAFKNSLLIYKQLDARPPIDTLSNLATIWMQDQQWGDALRIYNELLSRKDLARAYRASILVNKAICVRETSGAKPAVKILAKAHKLTRRNSSREHLIELNLVSAKTAIAAGSPRKGSRYIAKAVFQASLRLATITRYHYRRGLRERYNNRIAGLIGTLPDRGASTDILLSLCYLKQNSFSDWLATLQWYDDVINDGRVTTYDKTQLDEAMRALRQYGAPLLFWHQEKYDDPWGLNIDAIIDNEPLLPTAWERFGTIARDISARLETDTPWERASLYDPTQSLEKHLRKGNQLLVLSAVGERFDIYYIRNGCYARHTISSQAVIDYNQALNRYQFRSAPLRDLIHSQRLLVDTISLALRESLASIALTQPPGLIILPERLDAPVVASLVEHDEIREMLCAGKLTVTHCPIIFEGHIGRRRSTMDSFLGIHDSSVQAESPELDSDELQFASATFLRSEIVDTGLTDIGFDRIQQDALHFVMHGMPISVSADPMYAGIAGPGTGPFTIPEIQREFWRLPYRFVFLNSCYGGDISNHTRNRAFTSTELISFPTVFLLNRRSAVIAPVWAILDVAAFVFSRLFYETLKQFGDVRTAYSMTLGKLYSLDHSAVSTLLHSISDPVIRDRKLQLMASAGTYPFRQAYLYGCYQLHTLL